MDKLRPAILFSITLLICSCDSKESFDSDKWKHQGIDWQMSDVRENMVDDLVQSDTLIGMARLQVIALLGQPQFENIEELAYLIREKYSTDIDPEYISILIVEFNDGKVSNCRIEK